MHRYCVGDGHRMKVNTTSCITYFFFFFVLRVVFRNLGKFQEARRAALSTLIRELIKRNQEVRRK